MYESKEAGGCKQNDPQKGFRGMDCVSRHAHTHEHTHEGHTSLRPRFFMRQSARVTNPGRAGGGQKFSCYYANHLVCRSGGCAPPTPLFVLTVHARRKQQHVVTTFAAKEGFVDFFGFEVCALVRCYMVLTWVLRCSPTKCLRDEMKGAE